MSSPGICVPPGWVASLQVTEALKALVGEPAGETRLLGKWRSTVCFSNSASGRTGWSFSRMAGYW